MWVALFVNLSCTICMPAEVGQFKDEITCLSFVAHVLHDHPTLKARCEKKGLDSQKAADGTCPKGKGWCCSPNSSGVVVCRCKMSCQA